MKAHVGEPRRHRQHDRHAAHPDPAVRHRRRHRRAAAGRDDRCPTGGAARVRRRVRRRHRMSLSPRARWHAHPASRRRARPRTSAGALRRETERNFKKRSRLARRSADALRVDRAADRASEHEHRWRPTPRRATSEEPHDGRSAPGRTTDRSPTSRQRPDRATVVVRLGIVVLIVGRRRRSAFTSACARPWPTPEPRAKSWSVPYVDVTLTPTYQFQDPQSNPARDVALAFVVADPDDACTPSWGGAYTLDQAGDDLELDRRITQLRAAGGDVMVSFGGQANEELAVACTDQAALDDAYRAVIERYDVHVDRPRHRERRPRRRRLDRASRRGHRRGPAGASRPTATSARRLAHPARRHRRPHRRRHRPGQHRPSTAASSSPA